MQTCQGFQHRGNNASMLSSVSVLGRDRTAPAGVDRSASWQCGLRKNISDREKGLAYLLVPLWSFDRPFRTMSDERYTAPCSLLGHPGAAPNCFVNYPENERHPSFASPAWSMQGCSQLYACHLHRRVMVGLAGIYRCNIVAHSLRLSNIRQKVH